MILLPPNDLTMLLRFAAVRKLPDVIQDRNAPRTEDRKQKTRRAGWYPLAGSQSWTNVHHLSFADGILTLRSTDLLHTVSSSILVIGSDAAWEASVDTWRLPLVSLLGGGRLQVTLLNQRRLHFGKDTLRVRIPVTRMGSAFPQSVAGDVSRTVAEVSRDALAPTLDFLVRRKTSEPPDALRPSQCCTIFRDGAGMRADRYGFGLYYPGPPLGPLDLALHQESAARLRCWLHLIRTSVSGPGDRILITHLQSETRSLYEFRSACQRHTLVVPCHRVISQEIISRAKDRPALIVGRVSRDKLLELSKVIYQSCRTSETRWSLRLANQQWTLTVAHEPAENSAAHELAENSTWAPFPITGAFAREERREIGPFIVSARCLVKALTQFTSEEVIFLYRPTARRLGIRQDTPEPLAVVEAQRAAEAFLPVKPLRPLNAPENDRPVERPNGNDEPPQDGRGHGNDGAEGLGVDPSCSPPLVVPENSYQS